MMLHVAWTLNSVVHVFESNHGGSGWCSRAGFDAGGIVFRVRSFAIVRWNRTRTLVIKPDGPICK